MCGRHLVTRLVYMHTFIIIIALVYISIGTENTKILRVWRYMYTPVKLFLKLHNRSMDGIKSTL